MRAPRADHVVIQDGGVFRCRHCGDSYPMQLPVDLDVIAAAGKAYVRNHRHCKPAQPAEVKP